MTEPRDRVAGGRGIAAGRGLAAEDRGWVASRSPRAPKELLERVVGDAAPDASAGADDPEGAAGRVARLTGRARERLADVLRAPADEREAAFVLLEADALLTWACEAAADADDPAKVLDDALDLLSERA